MGNYELDLEERFSILNDMAESTGYVVMDTSAICNFIKSNYFNGEKNFEEELEVVKENIRFTRYLRHLVSEKNGIVFPEEVKKEFDFFTKDALINKKRSIGKFGKKRSNSHCKNYDLSDKLYSLAKEVKRNLKVLMKERNKFLREMPGVEKEINHRVKGFTCGIEGTILELSRKYFSRNIDKRNKRFESSYHGHRQNDEKIIAKSFALSYNSPVTMVTSDKDFLVIYNEIFYNLDKFSKNGLPSLPRFNLNLFLLNQDGSFKYFEPAFFMEKNKREKIKVSKNC